MLGQLTEKQIEELLNKQVTGHLGCHANGVTYVVPVNYVYKNNTIYAHSAEGQKVKMMRQNPEVCFCVDDIPSIFKWQSVIVFGTFEEVDGIDEKQQVMQGIIHRIMPLVTHPTGHTSHGITSNESEVDNAVKIIVFKIKVREKTGKFESN